MKKDLLSKKIILSLVASFIFAGCGSSSLNSNYQNDNSDPTKKESEDKYIRGKVVDGYLQNAKVCLDLNSDGVCSDNEPQTTTNQSGSYELKISVDIQNSNKYKDASILAYGGVDKDSGEDFIGVLQASKESDMVNITPITTLIAKSVKNGLNLDDAKKRVSKLTGVEVSKLTLDPIDEFNRSNGEKNLIKASLQLHKAIEAVALLRESDSNKIRQNIDKLYEDLAKGLKDEDSSFANLFDKTLTTNDSIIGKKVSSQIDKAFNELTNSDTQKLSKIAIVTQDLIKKARNNDDIEDIDYSKVDWGSKYISSDLEKIGITPNDEIVDKIKIAYSGTPLKGAIFKNPAKLKNSTALNEVYQKVVQKIYQMQNEKLQDKFEQAKKSTSFTPITDSTTLYAMLDNRENIGYTKLSFADGKVSMSDYIYNNGDFISSEDVVDILKNSYILNNGEWTALTKDEQNDITLKSGIAVNENLKESITLLDEKPFSLNAFLTADLNYQTTTNSDAKEYILKIEKNEDFYQLQSKTGYNTISEFISGHCGNSDYFSSIKDDSIIGGISFSADENGECDINATSGKLSQIVVGKELNTDGTTSYVHKIVNNDIGSWKIETLPNSDKKALIIMPYKKENFGDGEYIFYTTFASDSALDLRLWSGVFEPKGSQKFIPVINQDAIDTLKESYKEAVKSNLF